LSGTIQEIATFTRIWGHELTNLGLQELSATPAASAASEAPAPATKTVTTAEPTTTKATKDSSTITKQGDDEAHTFTAADDAKLVELKANGKTWKEIVAEIKKSQSALKERFKEVATNASGGSNTITKQGEDEAHTFTAADDAKLVDLKANGRTWKEIVAEMKKSQSALKERFKEVTTNTPGGPSTITKQGEDEAHTFTAADDAKLVEMKANGKTWKEIVTEMKKSQSALKDRFKEIGPNANAGTASGGGSAEGDAKKKESEAKATQAKATEGKKAEVKSQKSAAAAGKKGKKEVTTANEKTTKVSEHMSSKSPQPSLSASSSFNLSPPQTSLKPEISTNFLKPTTTAPCTSTKTTSFDPNNPSLSEIASKYQRDKWRFAASKYYDITGRRISMQEAKRRAEAELKEAE
jgi:hypothetical protein